MKYRPDIQLLRAIAVILVVGYHLGLPSFGKGFLGVDVFFVISGYLMQKLYRADEGAVAFWKRRAARLLPAYFVTIVATLAAGALLVLPDAFRQTAEQSAVAAVFMSNIGYWSAESYFSPFAFAPLLHLWSLGVELQYYLLVPPIVILCARWRWLMPVMILLSMTACLAMLYVSPKTSFFMMPMRLWEFGLGMTVAKREHGRQPLSQWLSVASMLVLVALMAWPIDGQAQSAVHGHPGVAALVACLATALALASRLPDRWLRAGPGLSAVRIGDWSYSIYLVHYPLIIFSFYRPFEGNHLGDGSAKAWALLIPCLGLAYALHRLVERRLGPIVTWPRTFAAMGSTVALAVVAPTQQAMGFSRYEQHIFASFQDRSTYRCGKLFRVLQPGEASCLIAGDPNSPDRILLVGDSHADAIKQSLGRVAAQSGWAMLLTVSNEPLLTDTLGPQWLAGEALRTGATRLVVHYHSAHVTPLLLQKSVEAARLADIPLTLIMPMPEASGSIPRLIFESRRAGQVPPAIALAEYDKRMEPFRAALAAYPTIDVIEVAPSLCRRGCALVRADGTPYYFDPNHLTLTGAARLEPLFAARIASWPQKKVATDGKSSMGAR